MSVHEVIFKGGLGNQIFCLFHAYKISLIYQNKVFLNLNNYSFSTRKMILYLIFLYLKLFDEFGVSTSIFQILFFYSNSLKNFYQNKAEDYG